MPRRSPLLVPKLQYCVSGLCMIGRIPWKCTEVSFSPAASRQILKTTDSETEEAAETKKSRRR